MLMINELFSASGITQKRTPLFDCKKSLFSSSHSVLAEGVDFDLTYTPIKYLGYKSVLSVIGPLYAEGFSPYSLSVKFALSSRFSLPQIEELWSGVTAAFKEHEMEHLELDLTPSVTGLIISLTSQGKQERERFVQKPPCKSSDLLCITGSLGAAYIGLHVLEREKALFEKESIQPNLNRYKPLLQAYLNPHIDKELISSLYLSELHPSAGEFIVNGLADAIKKVCYRYSLGAKIFMNKIPISSQISEPAKEINIDPVTAALNGGDDYKFLFAIPIDKHELLKSEIPQIDIIGHLCSADAGAYLITPDGAQFPLKAQAWDK